MSNKKRKESKVDSNTKLPEYKRLEPISKKLSECNSGELQGLIIQRFIQIEDNINTIITNYFKPENERLFRTVVLNSRVIDIGGKLKILNNIGYKGIIEKVRNLSNIRNAFAHTRFPESVHIKVFGDSTEEERCKIEVDSIIPVMNTNGKIINKSAYQYAKEFLDDEILLIKELIQLRNESKNPMPLG